MRALGLGTLVIAFLAVTALLDRETGVGIWLELRGDLASSTERVDLLIAQNDPCCVKSNCSKRTRRRSIVRFREELDLALPGEVVFRFLPNRTNSSASPSASEAGNGPPSD